MILCIYPHPTLISNPPFPYFRQTLKIAFWNYCVEFFYVCCFLKQKTFTNYETTVTVWKSKHLAFQNTKKFWKRCNTYEVRRIFVLESKSVNVHAYVGFAWYSTYIVCWVCMIQIYIHYVTTFDHMHINHCSFTYAWSNADFDFITKIFLTSRILHRF